MESHILARAPIDLPAIVDELLRVERLEQSAEYGEYIFGSWRSLPLWNGTGAAKDTRLREYENAPVATELVAEFPQISDLVRRTFRMELLKWARIFILDRGVILPHRDYLDLRKGFKRLHLPLRTDASCLHSEGNDVFHMRAGEVWYLDATEVHSACNLWGRSRISVCLDFVPEAQFSDVIRTDCERAPASTMVHRPLLTDDEFRELMTFARLMTADNFRDIVGALSLVHFYRNIGSEALFEWLLETARSSGSPELSRRVASLRALALGESQ